MKNNFYIGLFLFGEKVSSLTCEPFVCFAENLEQAEEKTREHALAEVKKYGVKFEQMTVFVQELNELFVSAMAKVKKTKSCVITNIQPKRKKVEREKIKINLDGKGIEI